MHYLKADEMIHTRDTGKIDTVKEASKSLEELSAVTLTSALPETKKHIETIRCALTVLEHKILRVKELEREFQKLKKSSNVSSEGALIAEIVDLQHQLDEANSKIIYLESLSLYNKTGTDM